MPINEEHKRKKSKNYILLAILVAVMAMFYYISVLKIGELVAQ